MENENHNGDLSELERPRELVTSLIKTSENSGGTPKRGKSEFHMLLPRPTDTNILHFVEEIFNSGDPSLLFASPKIRYMKREKLLRWQEQ